MVKQPFLFIDKFILSFNFRQSNVLIQKERQNYIIACFVLVLPSNGNQNSTNIAYSDILMKRLRPTFQMIPHLNAQKLSVNTLVLQKLQLFAIMALPTKLLLNTLKRQLRRIQVWKWQKRRLRLPHHCLIFQLEDEGL